MEIPHQDPSQLPPPSGSRFLKVMGIGCFILILLAGIGVAYVAANWENLFFLGFEKIASREVRNSNLPEDQKEGLIEQIGRITQELKRGGIDKKEAARLYEKLAEGPFRVWIGIHGVKSWVIDPSGLSAEEKAAGHMTLQRFGRYAHEQQIPLKELRACLDPILVRPRQDDGFEVKRDLTDAEVREFLASLSARADSANIPHEPFEVDLAAEAKKVVDAFIEERQKNPAPAGN